MTPGIIGPAPRFQSARDIAFDLQLLSGQTPSSARESAVSEPKFRKWLRHAAVAAATIGIFLAGYFTGGRSSSASP